jgi:signal transduction histidine kinase
MELDRVPEGVEPGRWIPPRLVLAAAAVCVAYYLGANVGLILRFPPTTPSVLWPPNSILTATLLLWPPRAWPFLLLAVLPAHVAAELPLGWPASLIGALYLTNCLEAVLAASLVRRFSDAPSRFDTLRRAGVFIVAAGVIAPLASTIVDAAAVWALHGESYAHVFVTRFASNALTALTLVPTIVIMVSDAPRWVRRASARRRVEAVALLVGLCAVAVLVFVSGGLASEAIPGAPVTPVVLLVPFILWASVRFGPAGTSVALVATATLASWAAAYGTGPFAGLRAAESVLALQLSLIVVAIPTLCLAALIAERQRAESALRERLAFEALLSRLSGAFVQLPSGDMDRAFTDWCRQVAAFLGVARVTLVRREVATRPSTAAAAGDVREHGSDVVVPLAAGERLVGSLVFTKPGDEVWSEETRGRVRLVAEVFANALARKENEDALRASEVIKSAILASLTSGVAVLDRDGWIIAVNDGWIRLAGGVLAGAAAALDVGDNYVEACRQAARADAADGPALFAGVCDVLGRRRFGFSIEHPGVRGRDEWFALSVVPLHRPDGGAVVSVTEISERKRAEMDAQQSRQELAHFSRVSTMGELAASLAHELNQPLAAILLNAQTARRRLDADPSGAAELREILDDIEADDTRAAEVIRRMRELLRKGDAERVRLDLNALVHEVIRLLGNDAVLRNVALSLEAGGEPLMVDGDRIQLQQVVLNLVLNAMEAAAEGGAADRSVLVRTGRANGRVCVAVRDNGPGLRDGTAELVFEPFYTTKATGMGMGLAIVRSIVRAHDGTISAANVPTGGAAFELSLPLVDADAI